VGQRKISAGCGDSESLMPLVGEGMGVPKSSLARKQGISIPSVTESVARGARIAEEKHLCLVKT
jgi:hypothetical protein